MKEGTTGSYIWDKQARKLVKISDKVPNVSPLPAWMPKGDLPYFDKSARRVFNSRSEKRSWMKQHKMREAGIIDPDKAPF